MHRMMQTLWDFTKFISGTLRISLTGKKISCCACRLACRGCGLLWRRKQHLCTQVKSAQVYLKAPVCAPSNFKECPVASQIGLGDAHAFVFGTQNLPKRLPLVPFRHSGWQRVSGLLLSYARCCPARQFQIANFALQIF